MKNEELFNKVLYAQIDELKQDKANLEKKLDKLITNFNARDIEKLTRISNEINQIDYTMHTLYALIGNMDKRINKVLENI